MTFWVAGAVVVGGAISGIASSNAADKAASAQENAANTAAGTQMSMFNTTNDQQKPYRDAGSTALSSIASGFGAQSKANFDSDAYLRANPDVAANAKYGNDPYQHYLDYGKSEGRAFTQNSASTSGVDPGQFSHQFGAADLGTNLSPSYNFMLGQGLQSVNNQNSVTGGLVGGNALKGINDYAQNYASNGYQQAYNNYNTNQSNIYNRLASIAGLGQTATGQTGTSAMTTAGNVGSAQLAGGAAAAAGYIGQGNAISGAVNGASGAAGWYGMNNGNSGASNPNAYTSTGGFGDANTPSSFNY